jgi:hypothetical protein
MANRPDALQSSRKSQCFSAFVRTTWLYRPDVIQCLTRIRVSASRHSYGKTATTVRTMCDPVRTMFSIRQDVHTKFNHPDVNLHGPDDQASYMEIAYTSSTIRTSPFRFRTLQSLIMVIMCSQSATVRTLGQHCLDVTLLWELWGWLPPPCPIFSFSFFFFLKKISIFIYFLINLYYFIKMCMSAPRVVNKMATCGADVVFDGIC